MTQTESRDFVVLFVSKREENFANTSDDDDSFQFPDTVFSFQNQFPVSRSSFLV